MPEPSFSTKVVRSDGATIIYVQGEIDLVTAERLRDAIEPHMGPEQTIVLDLSGVEFMDSVVHPGAGGCARIPHG